MLSIEEANRNIIFGAASRTDVPALLDEVERLRDAVGEQLQRLLFREFFEFEVMHTPEQAPTLLASLHPVFESASVRYWVVPVLSHGHL